MEDDKKASSSQYEEENDNKEELQNNNDNGIDSDFTAWGEKPNTMKNFEPVDINIPTENTHFPSIKDDKAFNENPLYTEEADEHLPTDTLNERETRG